MTIVQHRIDGKEAVATGQAVISPDHTFSLFIAPIEIKFEFEKPSSAAFGVDLIVTPPEVRVKIKSPPPNWASFDLFNLKVLGKNCTMAVAILRIGGERAHQVLNYTLYEDAVETG